MMQKAQIAFWSVCLLSLPGARAENPAGAASTVAADLVIRNARVVTIDKDNPRAEAIACKGERIVAVTSNEAIRAYIRDGVTEVIDARGGLVVPGFNDAHVHFEALDPDFIDLRYTTDPAVIAQKVKAAVARAQPGQLIRGGYWDHEMFIDRRWPTKELLDAVAPDNPVVLDRSDGHSVLVNSYVLRKSGITKGTSDPFGGAFLRDLRTGEPTGIVQDTAMERLKYGDVPVRRTPEQQRQRLRRGWQAAFEMAVRHGVTSIQLASGNDTDAYQEFLDRGELPIRVTLAGVLTADPNELKRYAELRRKYPPTGNWIRFGYLKGFADGSLGSGTALFYEPYVDVPTSRGLAQMSYAELERRVVAADKAGFQIGIHAIGDEAIHWALDAFEKARQVNGVRDSRHRIEHAQHVADADIPRFAAVSVIASMQPTHCITDKRFAEKRIGLARCHGAYAWRRFLDAGAMIAFGTDYPVEPINPLEGLYAAVTRKDRAGEPGDGWFPAQKLSMEKTIELYTRGSARAEFMEDRKGMIKAGYLGDVVVFDRDLLATPDDQIMSARVDCTIVGGKIVYRRSEAP
jgi:predicted amidohydrolase YtcJ